ncbi:hypothetical protein D9Q98_008789 [Chlorella vulgaris]|uniref:Antifreeze protein n=1 Tax=Chlorella vulgaris TaxID=3077 RepID=A0A9D4YU79_CHLVU|nr:hypothetical protein D9Q98_008789 [Chlorella vulgaris]
MHLQLLCIAITFAGTSECGGGCIDPLQECCPSYAPAGLQCPSATTVGSTVYPAQTCNATINACGCPAGFSLCGYDPGICINTTSQCCITDPSVGLKCGATSQKCTSDGAACSSVCPAGFLTCGSGCYNATATTSNCCIADTVTVGTKNLAGSCIGGAICYRSYSGITITGRRCPNSNKPRLCMECCDDNDCPDYLNNGVTCKAGFCSSDGCTIFQCYNGNSKQVCKVKGGGTCTSCNAGTGMRCPSGTCCLNGQASCVPVGNAGCGNYCCAAYIKCDNQQKFQSTQGRECNTGANSGGTACERGLDPYFYSSAFNYTTITNVSFTCGQGGYSV